MALSASEVVTLAEVIGETPDEAQAALDAAARVYSAERMAAIEDATRADLTEWATIRPKRSFRLAGGKDGVHLDYGPRGAELTRVVRTRLGLSAVSESEMASDPNAVRLTVLKGVRW